VSSLSGGNQQKVVLARELSRPLGLLMACQPTRGLDVGAIEFVHKRLIDERDRGTAVIIVSTELDEVVALADRIAVMYRGRIVGIVPPDTSREVLGLLMAGVPTEEALASASRTKLAEEDNTMQAIGQDVRHES
jgi:general nucleoside transport system ATP-binding protein